MRAVVQRRYGGPDTLALEHLPVPSPGPDEVLVEVHAAGVDRGTEHLMTGRPWLVRLAGYGLRRPRNPVPGLDVAGRVVAVGAAVTRFRIGDEVLGTARGSFAEYAVAPESALAAKPVEVSFVEAAALTVSGTTALEALVDVGGPVAGRRVLVIGASGGVGSHAVQIARVLGARVDAVAGTPNLAYVAALGADTVHDHRTTSLDAVDTRYDLVVDIGGRNPLRRLRRLLLPGGTLVIVGGENGNRLTGGVGRQVRALVWSRFIAERLAVFISEPSADRIERLLTLVTDGGLRPPVEAVFPLAEAPTALRHLASGSSRGKTVLTVRP
ncbi:MAG: NAD(P)-dependent alcohol dehydrogenase [Actinomyces sp.]|nr:MAG: NAD(P)-dependent alcohol dehydrogenase [Actinomyces sp.]